MGEHKKTIWCDIIIMVKLYTNKYTVGKNKTLQDSNFTLLTSSTVLMLYSQATKTTKKTCMSHKPLIEGVQNGL